MTRDQLLQQYYAEVQILNQCLVAGGGSYTAPTYSKAVLFRQRCYVFMKKFREAAAEGSRYDVLVIKALPPKRSVPNIDMPISVRIEVRSLDGDFVPDQEITTPEAGTEADPMLDEALAIRQRLGL